MFAIQGNAGAWNNFAEKCQTLQTHVTTAQKQIDDVKKLYDMPAAKTDHEERVAKATKVKTDIAKTFEAVQEANSILQVRLEKYGTPVYDVLFRFWRTTM